MSIAFSHIFCVLECLRIVLIFLLFLFFVVLGFELRVYTLRHSTSAFLCWVFFEIEPRELFAWAGLKPRSSTSLHPE
jgi:hypothetical protein